MKYSFFSILRQFRVLTAAFALLLMFVSSAAAGLFDKLKMPDSASSAMNIVKSLNVTEADEIEIGGGVLLRYRVFVVSFVRAGGRGRGSGLRSGVSVRALDT